MNPRECRQALLARCTLSNGTEVRIGPFFTEDRRAIRRRVPRLLRHGYFETSFQENPLLVETIIDAANVEIDGCNLYDAYLFARPEKTAEHYYPASRHVRTIEDLRALSQNGGWSCFLGDSPDDTDLPRIGEGGCETGD